jgi:cell division protein FtsL
LLDYILLFLTVSYLQVTDKLQALNDEFAAKTKEKKELEDSINLCSMKLDRAEKLLGKLTRLAVCSYNVLDGNT